MLKRDQKYWSRKLADKDLSANICFLVIRFIAYTAVHPSTYLAWLQMQ